MSRFKCLDHSGGVTLNCPNKIASDCIKSYSHKCSATKFNLIFACNLSNADEWQQKGWMEMQIHSLAVCQHIFYKHVSKKKKKNVALMGCTCLYWLWWFIQMKMFIRPKFCTNYLSWCELLLVCCFLHNPIFRASSGTSKCADFV